MAQKSTGKKTTGRKPSTSKKTTSTRKKAAKQEVTASFGKEAAVLLVLVFSVLLCISNFGLAGKAGELLKYGNMAIFGVMGYLTPFALFGLFCFLLANQASTSSVIRSIGCIFVLLGFCGFAQLISGTDSVAVMTIRDYWEASAKGAGGGVIGGIYVKYMVPFFGTAGAYIFDFAILFFGALMITGFSLIDFLKSAPSMPEKKERLEAEENERIQREEYNRLRREERAVRKTKEYEEKKYQSQKHIDEMKRQTEMVKKLRSEHTVVGISSDTFIKDQKEPQIKQPEPLKKKIAPVVEVSAKDLPEAKKKDAKPDEIRLQKDIRTVKELDQGETIRIRKFDAEVPEEKWLKFEDPEVQEEMEVPAPDFLEEKEAFYEEAYEEHLASDYDDIPMPRYVEEEIVSAAEEIPEMVSAVEHQETPVKEEAPAEYRTVTTASGKIITVELDGIPGAKKVEAVKKEDRESDIPVIIESKQKKEYIFPPMTLLQKGKKSSSAKDMDRELRETAAKLQSTLMSFGVGVTVTDISCGPAVTRYELQPEQGVKVSRILSLQDDIKLNLAASDIRIEAPIPGKAAIGIEVPNKENATVMMRDLLESEEFKNHKSSIAFATGKDIAGTTVIADIAKMPHLLIAGATGSGKSVCINTIIMSVLYHAKPTDVKLIMIDPKVVELSVYNGIPHLLIPVVTDPKKAAGALNWAVAEMTKRYQQFAEYNVRDMAGFNKKIDEIYEPEDPEKPGKMPRILIIVDELADLMMVAPGDVEDAICRLAQLARAAGIHLVIATQRPSVNVITGLIKANVPSRIAFAVSSGVDSRTILDMNGAEKLLGKGDMLYFPQGMPKPLRVQGAFVSDKEVMSVVSFLTNQKDVIGGGHDPAVLEQEVTGAGEGVKESDFDPLFADAARFLIEKDKGSIGVLQRQFRIGFNRAARIMDQLASAGVVGEEEGTKPRKILMSLEQLEEIL